MITYNKIDDLGPPRISGETRPTNITVEIAPQKMPFKFIIGDCWRNISYKKFIRLTKKKSRKSVLIFIKKWENATGYSRYDAYFQRAGKVVTFSIYPFPATPEVRF